MISKLRHFIPQAVIITGLSGLIYWTVQQDIRIGSYEPQIQLSEDMAASISAGVDPVKLMPADNIEISKSKSPYLVVFDDNGKVLATNAKLNGQAPKVPQGVLDFAKTNGQDRISWQPAGGVRSAIVVTHFSNSKISGSVLAGRSLLEAEKRVDTLGAQVGLAYIVTMVATFFATLISADTRKK